MFGRAMRFKLEKKLVVQVRYFENMYCLKDADGIRIFTTSDEKMARRVLTVLNAYEHQRKFRAKPQKKIKPRKLRK